MKKRIFGIILCLILTAALLPAAALAAPGDESPVAYNIWVNEVQINAENKGDVFNDGTISYDPDTNTLSLNNANIVNESLDYGIKTSINSKLNVKLTGTNKISLHSDGGGIALAGAADIDITGTGELIIDVDDKDYDGISTSGNVTIDKTSVKITATGLGIASSSQVTIIGSKVESTGNFAGIDAVNLLIKDKSEVNLKALDDERNGAYIHQDNEGNGGIIEINDSKVTATSFYPGLFAVSSISISGGEVKSVSTADSAIWSRGNINLEKNVKLYLEGKYPAGCKGQWSIKAADVDAKNTNEQNIPAIDVDDGGNFNQVLADGYYFTYAMAVDSEGTEINLFERNETQYLNNYKNVHFKTGAISFNVLKTDNSDPAVPLQGATFRLETMSDVPTYYEAESNEQGIATFNAVPNGTYTLKEVKAPKYYNQSQAEYRVIVNNMDQEGKILRVAKVIGDDDIIITIPGIGLGQGQGGQQEFEFFDYQNGTTIASFVNKPQKTYTIRINKTDENNKPLADAEFVMYEEQGADEHVYTAVSDEKGVAEIKVPVGTYKLREATAPFGYLNSQDEYRLDVSEEGIRYWDYSVSGDSLPYPAKGVTFVNKAEERVEYSLPISKTVEQLGTATPGRMTFTFELWAVVGEDQDANQIYRLVGTQDIVTNGKGTSQHQLTFKVPVSVAGSCVLKEKAGTANGWTYSTAEYNVHREFQNDQPKYIYNLRGENGQGEDLETASFTNQYNYKASGGGGNQNSGTSFTVNKTTATGDPLAGAVFVLKNSRGTEVYKETSDSNGKAAFKAIESGTYTLEEKSAPNGYVKSETTYTIKVDGDKITVNDKKYENITVVNYKEAELNRTDHFAFLIGYEDGTFGPDRNMTRAEVTAMFARLMTEKIDADKTYSTTFSDVPSAHWAANYIGYMQQFGIVMGYPDGTFDPDAPVTRAQFAAIASRFEKLTAGDKSFSDVPNNHWAAKYINFASTRGWVNGYSDGTFKPENYITRAEVAAVTCRLLERSADQTYIRSNMSTLPRTFTDIKEGESWAYWYIMEAANGHDYTKSAGQETWTRTYR